METTDPSGFPSERPEGGDIFYSVKTDAGWQAAQQLTTGEQGLNPSTAPVPGGVAAVWLERSGEDGGSIIYHTLSLPENEK
jgi:hypothetical protein